MWDSEFYPSLCEVIYEFYAGDTSRKIRAVQKAKGKRGCR